MPLSATYDQSKIISNDSLSESVRHLIIQPENFQKYKSGQFFMLRLRNQSGEYIERSYSVANYSEKEKLEFVIRIEPEGQMTSLIDKLNAEDSIDIKGPFGKFGFSALEGNPKKLVLIAAGVGLAPIRSMLQQTFGANDEYPIQLFYGFRFPENFLFRDELENYVSSGRLELITAASTKEDIDWKGNRGHILDFFKDKIFSPEEGSHCFICGPPAMVKESREKLFELGFERNQVHVEAW